MAIAAFYTKTFRLPDGTVTVVPPGIDYGPPEGAQEIHEIRDIKIHFPVSGAVTAYIELFPRLDTVLSGMVPKYMVTVDGIAKEVRRVEFTDGSSWKSPND